jgi:CheY-like chemotaxis protein
MRLLVVEDDKKIASFVLKGLKQAGFVVDHADNGQEGLHLTLTAPYDVAVVDVMLPGLDGLSLIEHLRELIGTVGLDLKPEPNQQESKVVELAKQVVREMQIPSKAKLFEPAK